MTDSTITQSAAPTRDQLVDLIVDHLTATYHCTRVWEAWNVGTMTQDDFEPAAKGDLPGELADAILAALSATPQVPIPMILRCPACNLQHVDGPDERTPNWENKPHRSHLCHGCGHVWRPADVETEGVAEIKTRGKDDSATPQAPAEPVPMPDDVWEFIRKTTEGPQGYRRALAEAGWKAAIDLGLATPPAQEVQAREPDMPAICAALGFDPTNHHNAAKCPYCRPAQEVQAKPLDDPRLQKLFSDAITGALAFGAQNSNPPPLGHWLQHFWDIGRVERASQEVQASQAGPSDAALRRCLGFFASVIKSGEPWTETCEREYRAALTATHAAQPVAQAWTSIADRMPVEGDTVICHAGFTPYLAYLIYGTDAAGNHVDTWTQDGEREQRPTHWMPLPPFAQTRAEPTPAAQPVAQALPSEATEPMLVAMVTALLAPAPGEAWEDRAQAAWKAAMTVIGAPAAQPVAQAGALPDRVGVYAWVTQDGHASLVLVNKRPTAHSDGGKLNATVMESSKFYDGCAVDQWGKDGRWVLLHDFKAAQTRAEPTGAPE